MSTGSGDGSGRHSRPTRPMRSRSSATNARRDREHRNAASEHGFDPLAYMRSYAPRNGRAARSWPQTRPFVIEQVVRLGPASRKEAQYAAWVIAGIAAFASSVGVSLEPERVLHPSFVQRYVEVGSDGGWTTGTLRTVRDYLYRVGPKLTVRAPWIPKERALGRSHLSTPYSSREISSLWAAVATQSADDRLQAEFALGTGLAWGLDGRWITRIGPGTVEIDDCGVHATVPNPLRTVTALAELETRLARAIRQLRVVDLGTPFPTTTALNAFVHRINHRLGASPLDLSRLRSTWLLTHLQAGTPLPALLYGAGLTTAGNLTDLIRLIPLPDSDLLTVHLRRNGLRDGTGSAPAADPFEC